MKIIFIRHAESYANSIKKYNKIDYNERKIINYSTLESEKIKFIENRLFDTFLTQEGIDNCIKNIKKNNKITIITSPLKRALITTFFLYYNNFIDNGSNIEIFISNNLKEIFYYPNDLLENYNDNLDDQINDIRINIIDKMKIGHDDIENKFDIYVNILKKNLLNNNDENEILKYCNQNFKNIDESIRIDDDIKKKFYLESLKELIKRNNINTDINIITHWGVISSIFSIKTIHNLDEFDLNLEVQSK
jgi:hypothetical protein